jgi:hypothetical protein
MFHSDSTRVAVAVGRGGDDAQHDDLAHPFSPQNAGSTFTGPSGATAPLQQPQQPPFLAVSLSSMGTGSGSTLGGILWNRCGGLRAVAADRSCAAPPLLGAGQSLWRFPRKARQLCSGNRNRGPSFWEPQSTSAPCCELPRSPRRPAAIWQAACPQPGATTTIRAQLPAAPV